MKALIAIGSNAHGVNQPIRDTWLKDIDGLGFNYKFFYGEGGSVELTQEFIESVQNMPAEYEKKQTCCSVPSPVWDNLVGDEVGLAVPDGHFHVPFKTRSIFMYALNHGFDFVFKCFEDTYVSPAKLAKSGFEQWDYSGRLCGNDEMGYYASGGPGYWVSERAMKALTLSPVTRWADDWWVGTELRRAGIELHADWRYAEIFDLCGRPRVDNEVISSHLAITPTVYTAGMMYEAHKQAQLFTPIRRGIRRWMQPTT